MEDAPTLDTVAAAQHGVVSRAQLTTLGWSSGRIARAVRRGDLERVASSVYRTAGAPSTRRARLQLVLLVAGDDAALSHWTAAELLGLTDRTATSLHVTVPGRRGGPSLTGTVVHRPRDLPDDHRCEVDGLAVTGAGRTIRDLAATQGHRRLAELMAAAVRTRACTLDELRELAETRRLGRGGERFGRAVRVLGGDGGRARSDAEVAALTAIVEAGLPRPAVGHRILAADGALLAEVDLSYPELLLAIEIDGYRWHASPAQKRRDERRTNQLVQAGWTVLRFTASDVLADPDSVVRVLRATLTSLARPTGGG